MLYLNIHDLIKHELYTNGNPNPDLNYEIEVALIYNALFGDDKELSDRANFLIKNSKLNKMFVKKVKNEINKLDQDQIEELVLYMNEDLSRNGYSDVNSEPLSLLAYYLLDIKYGDVLLDFGCSYGAFLTTAHKEAKQANLELMKYIGVEMNQNSADVAKMIMNILRMASDVCVGDYINDKLPAFSKALVFAPLGNYINKENHKSLVFPDLSLGSHNKGWLFVDRLVSNIYDGKKAVAILSASALFASQSKDYRNRLLKEGYIEGIIELPPGILWNSGAALTAIVLSKNNKKVKFVDAKNNSQKINTKFANRKIDIYRIIEDYNNKKENYISIKDLIDPSSLTFSAVTNVSDKNIKDGKTLGSVAEVLYGSQYTISKFKDSISSKPTNKQIVVSSDIEDGTIDWQSLPYIEGFEVLEKYAVQKGDLIMTSKSSKIKIAYVDIEPKNNIIVTGGMIIIRPSKKIDGTFLKVFLESEEGQKILKSIQKGTVITTINTKDLSRITIPVPPIKKQEEIAKKYNSKLSTLIALKEEVKRVESQLRDFYRKEAE